MELDVVHCGDALEILRTMKSGSVNMGVTSPPYYGLRDYGVDGQIGLEDTPEEYIARLVDVFREVRRVLRDDGTLWVNIGDSYAGSGKGAWKNKNAQKEVYVIDPGSAPTKTPKKWPGIKEKDLIGIPWMLAFALRADGWYLRQDIIWSKPNPMPESVKDRCTSSHEHIFLFSKQKKYYFDNDAIMEPCVSDKGNAKTFRGGGAYTQNQAFDNSAMVERQSHGNKKNTRYGGRKYSEHPDSFYRTKSENMYEQRPLREKRDVWTLASAAFSEAHFATFPLKLVEPCILAGCPPKGVAIDPFMGSGTTGIAAKKNHRHYIGIDIKPDYVDMSDNRIFEETRQIGMDFG